MSELSRLSDDELWMEWVTNKRSHSDREWLRLLKQATIGMADRPRDPVVAYRGSPNPRGMSWTESRRSAEKFARLQRSPVWKTTIEPGAIVAVAGREIVVDAAMLGTVRQVENTAPRRHPVGRRPRERGRTIFAAKMAEQRSSRGGYR